MDCKNHLIIKDGESNTWDFYLNENGHILYSIISEDGARKEKNTFNADALEFSIDIDKTGLHLIYINRKGEFKYCLLSNNFWTIRTICTLSNKFHRVRELSLSVTDECVNMFYILLNENSNYLASLYYNKWDGEECSNSIISDIRLLPNTSAHYYIERLGQKDISLFLIDNVEEGGRIRNFKYIGGIFKARDLKFSLPGNTIDFTLIKHSEGVGFLNISEDYQNYSLDYINVDSKGSIAINNIFKCGSMIKNPILIKDKEIIWAFWMIGNRVFYTIKKGNWLKVEEFKTGSMEEINIYYYIEESHRRKTQRVLGTVSPDIKLILPSKPYSHSVDGQGNQKYMIKNFDIREHKQDRYGNRRIIDGKDKGKLKEHQKEASYIVEGKTDYNYNSKKDKLESLKIRFPELEKESGWNKEALRSQLKLTREKAQIEEKYKVLLKEKEILEAELDTLKNSPAAKNISNFFKKLIKK